MDLSTLPIAQREFYESIPFWATVAFAVAVVGGVLGCIALLFRQSWAVLLMWVSLFGIVVQISHSILLGDGIAVFGAAGLALPLMTLVIAVALLWFAKYSANRGWLSPKQQF